MDEGVDVANFNRVILAGNLTRDPELTYIASGTAVCKFGLAINRNRTDRQSNERREETTFVDCTAWAKPAELINQYCSKGKPLLVEGRLAFDTWTTPDGQKRSKLYVVVENFQFLGSAGGGGQGGGGQGGGGQSRSGSRGDQGGGQYSESGQGGRDQGGGAQGGGGRYSDGGSGAESYDSSPTADDVPF